MRNIKEKMKEEKKEKTEKKMKEEKFSCADKKCPFHGSLKTRGRIFEGYVTKKFPKRVVVEFERKKYIRKYERYAKTKTKLHARLPECLDKKENIQIEDYVRIMECRPLSKIIHFVVIKKINIETKIKNK